MNELSVTNGISLGGIRITEWPSGGGGSWDGNFTNGNSTYIRFGTNELIYPPWTDHAYASPRGIAIKMSGLDSKYITLGTNCFISGNSTDNEVRMRAPYDMFLMAGTSDTDNGIYFADGSNVVTYMFLTGYGTSEMYIPFRFSENIVMAKSLQIAETNRVNEAIFTNGVTIGGERRTTWPTAGSVDTNTVIASGYGLGTNTTFKGMISVVNTAAVNEAIFTNGVTIGGERRTTWPTGGTGGAVSALTNVVMYQQVFYIPTTNNPAADTNVVLDWGYSVHKLILTNSVQTNGIVFSSTNQVVGTNGVPYINLAFKHTLGNAVPLTFPTNWTFQGVSAPTALASGKWACLSLWMVNNGTNDNTSDIIAGYNVAP